jgi:RNA polymerase sigma factor (sigma-70 family)
MQGVLRHLRSLRDTQALSEAPDAQLLECFVRGHDEAPFAALVRRHGPMVWSVSRRVLPHEHDAEDVFQATFLLLARKAGSIRKTGSVGSWLHGVAHRLALKVRLQQARQQAREKRAADMRQTRPNGESSASEVQAALDAALGELPEKYRAALVLCYLEGKTQEEAARRLGCPLATVRTRVARGRKLLRDRLASHGLPLSTAGLATLLIASAAPAAAPAALVKAAVQAALPFAAGQSAAALCSKQAAGLVAGGLRAMLISKVKTVTVVLLAASLVVGAAALAQRVTAADETAKAPAGTAATLLASESKAKAADEKDAIAYGGRVLGPDGQPVAGARLFLIPSWGYIDRPAPSPVYATTGLDGRFQFKAPKAKFENHQMTTLAATANGHGVVWIDMDVRDKKDDVTLHLVKDDIPVVGQVIDLQGQPVQGATIRVLHIKATDGEDLRAWLAAVQRREARSLPLEGKYFSRQLMSPEVPDLPHNIVTDADGRFRLTGIGQDRLLTVQVSGPSIATQDLHILTRPGQPIEIPETTFYLNSQPASFTTYYGAKFRHVAEPGRLIVGVVRDKDTKQPLAGITLKSYKVATKPISSQDIIQATTDAQGRYRLAGVPRGAGNKLVVVPGPEQPYLYSVKEVADGPGLGPITVDLDLKRGVWIEGRITDAGTGKPLQGIVEYFALYGNPNLPNYKGFDGAPSNTVTAKADGSYRIVGIPGPGVVAVSRMAQYLQAAERDDEDGAAKEASLRSAPYHLSHFTNRGAVARINPGAGVAVVKRNLTLVPGWTFTGTLLGPDGKLLAGARGFCLTSLHWWEPEELQTGAFTVRAFNPRLPRDILFQHREKGLVGVARPPQDNGGAVTVRMERGAAVTGRLVDANLRPRANVELAVTFHPKGRWWHPYSPDHITTDRDGRFRVEALVPGYEYQLSDGTGEASSGNALGSGATKDLGDVQMKGENQ